MHTPVQHVYKQPDDRDGLLYAWFPAMHTRVDIVLCDKPEKTLLPIVDRIYETLHQLEKIASFYHPDSELYQVNRQADKVPVKISRELYTLIDFCLEQQKKTSGCFDIAIQSCHYGKETAASISLLPEQQTVFYRQPGTKIDLSGYLKGYALEKVRTILCDQGVKNALINMGNSSVLALGNHPQGKGWKVSFGNATHTCVSLYNQCLTTSGNETDVRKHIISPQTGKRIEGARRIAVVTENGAIGEILSTSLFVATPLQREELVKTFGIEEIYDI